MILRFPEFKTRAITLSFDDGHIDDRKMVISSINMVSNAPLILFQAKLIVMIQG